MLVWKKENWTIKRRYVREGVHEGGKKKEILGHPEMSEQLLRISAVKGKEIVWPLVLGLSGTHLDFFLSQKLLVVSLCLCFNWALWAYPEIKFRLWTCLFLLNATCVSLHELFFLLLLCVKPVRISFFFFLTPIFGKMHPWFDFCLYSGLYLMLLLSLSFCLVFSCSPSALSGGISYSFFLPLELPLE